MEQEIVFRELPGGTSLANGKYIIEKSIGAGGFGITYRARHTLLNKTCAVKEFFIDGRCVRHTQSRTVQVQGMQEETFEKYRQRFIEEARTLEKLDHPGIIRIIDVFEENNTSYIVMPFIEGKTLQQIVEDKGRLDYPNAVNYIAQLAEAVEYIHKRNILHRDIKPDNVMITPDNKVVLIDFGSAREFVNDATQSHTSILTQGYAPLEQYSTVSRKGSYSDIYSMGGVFYFALTGNKPVDATSRALEILPAPKELLPDIPEEASRTTMKAMQLKIENRHQNVQEFMDDLLGKKPSVLVDESIGGKKKIGKKVIFSIIAAALAVFAAIFFIVINQTQKEKENERIVAEKNKIIIQSKVVSDSIALNIVFWDENGQHYHLFRNCQSMSGNISEGTVEQAFEKNKKQLCPECIKNVAKYKGYRTEARSYYNSALDLEDEKYFNRALDYCNKTLEMRPDNKRINDLKQDIESRRK